MKLAPILVAVILTAVIRCSGADKGRLEGHAFLTSEPGRPLSDTAQVADIRLLNISFYIERDLIRFWAIELTRQRALIQDVIDKARPYSDRILKNQEMLLKAEEEGKNLPGIEEQITKDTEQWKAIVAPLKDWNGTTNFFANLPEPLERATTDLSGKF